LSRILIFAEAVTLAHVARPIALARILRELGHEVCIAAAPTADRWLEGEDVARWHIDSIPSSQFLRALALGVPAYDAATLKRYVEDDLRAISAWSPDIVMGDFRLSLYISTRLARKPYGAIANAYWSRRYFPGVDAPDTLSLGWLPKSLANGVFRIAFPAIFSLHGTPFRRACRHFRVESPGSDIRDMYTASDVTAFADVEGFYQPTLVRGNDTFVGPLPWRTTADPLPAIVNAEPIVFLALGSSGRPDLLPRLLAILDSLPLRYIVAGLPPQATIDLRRCIHQAAFVDYGQACAAANIAICNGGAPATYASLASGTPVIGVVSNLDQVLNMHVVERLGAGISLNVHSLNRRSVARAVELLVTSKDVKAAVRNASRQIAALGTARIPISKWIERLERSARNSVPEMPRTLR